MKAQWQNSRKIHERIIVTGFLVLETPSHFGSGDADGPVDMPLLLDPLEGRALLTGTSIAGALRNYLKRFDSGLTELLFGSDPDGSRQSLLFVDDALGEKPVVEVRDGVAINPCTRAAEENMKYDLELLSADTGFKVLIELLVQKDCREGLIKGLALALRGLEKGEIRLGGRKRRGFGRCKVKSWEMFRFDMTKPAGLVAWLANDRTAAGQGTDIAALLGVNVQGYIWMTERTATGNCLTAAAGIRHGKKTMAGCAL
jgi:CRISPR/Cas system CSM-associated protein Csm3 (group 7 of RAMP superfamily)